MIAWRSGDGYRPPYVSQPMYNLLARGIEQEYLADVQGVRRFHRGLQPAGRRSAHRQAASRAAASRARVSTTTGYTWIATGIRHTSMRWIELQEIARHAGRSPIDIALSWLLHHTPVDCVTLGASKLEQLEQNLELVEGSKELPAEVLAAIEGIWNGLRGVTPKYNR